MKHTWWNALLCGVILLMSSFGAAEELTNYLPTSDELAGWWAKDAPQQVTGDELFSLIDGAAEVYFEYGFSRALVQYYANDREQALQIEIYEMTDPAAAFGIFSFHAVNEGRPIAIGNDGVIGEYYLSFWQETYFVMLSVSESEFELLDLLKQTAQKIITKLPSGGEHPALVTYLLAHQPTPLAVKYIRGKLGLFNLTRFDADVTNGFDEGAIADYNDFEVVLLHYRSSKTLISSFEQTRQIFEINPANREMVGDPQSFSFTDPDGISTYGTMQREFFCLISGKKAEVAAEYCQALLASSE